MLTNKLRVASNCIFKCINRIYSAHPCGAQIRHQFIKNHIKELKDVNFMLNKGEIEPDSGSFKWGITTSQAFLARDYNDFFEDYEENLIDWLRQFSEEKSESFIRGFLGKMLFSGEEPLKKASVLSGGEKVRCMFSKLVLSVTLTL